MLQYRELQNDYAVLPAILDAGLRCKGTCTASPTPFQTLALLRPPLQPQQDRARPGIHRILSTTALRRLECLSCRMLLRHSRHNLVRRGSAVLGNGTLQARMLLERARLEVARSEGLFGLYIYTLWTVWLCYFFIWTLWTVSTVRITVVYDCGSLLVICFYGYYWCELVMFVGSIMFMK